MKKIVLALLFCSCAIDPEIVRRSGIRRSAGARLDMCLRSPPGRPWNEEACIAEQHRYCQSRGLEKNCGIDDAFWIITDRNIDNSRR